MCILSCSIVFSLQFTRHNTPRTYSPLVLFQQRCQCYHTFLEYYLHIYRALFIAFIIVIIVYASRRWAHNFTFVVFVILVSNTFWTILCIIVSHRQFYDYRSTWVILCLRFSKGDIISYYSGIVVPIYSTRVSLRALPK